MPRGWPLLLHGLPGRGKTAIAGLLFMGWPRRGLWINALEGFAAVTMVCGERPQWLWGMRPDPDWAWQARQRREARGMWDELAAAPFAVLDDIGLRARASDAQNNAMQRFLLTRGVQPTVYTSNLDLEGLARAYDDRVASRLAAGTVIEVGGEDRRLTCPVRQP